MANGPSRALARLREQASTGALDRLCRRHDVRLLVAFGSAINPKTAAGARDIDLAVLVGEGFDLLDFLHDIAVAAGPVDVDVMDLGRAGPVARDRALSVCVPLHEAEPGLFARQQIAAGLERMDTAWMRRLDLETMAR